MSSKQLEELKTSTLQLEDTIQSISHQFNELQTQLTQISKDSKNEEIKENKSVISDQNRYLFLGDAMEFSLKNGYVPATVYRGTIHPRVISKQGLDWCFKNFEQNENDIFVQTYPKCGTTFTLQILYQILTKSGLKVLGARPDLFPDPTYSLMWLELKASQDIYKNGNNSEMINFIKNNNSNTIRLWKTHSNLMTFPCKDGMYTGKCKIIHVTRNPKDVIQSSYRFFSKTLDYSGDFESYFEMFINGLTMHNDMFTFEMDTVNMIRKYGKDKILFLYYENLILDQINEIKKIIQFLGIKNLNENEIKEIQKLVSFDFLKKKQEIVNESKKLTIANLNKGKIGAWKNVLSKKQSDIIDNIIKQRIEPFNKELEEDMKIKWYFG